MLVYKWMYRRITRKGEIFCQLNGLSLFSIYSFVLQKSTTRSPIQSSSSALKRRAILAKRFATFLLYSISMVTFDWQFRPGGGAGKNIKKNNIWFRLRLRGLTGWYYLVFFLSHSRGIDFCRCRYGDRYDVITDYTPHLHNILSLGGWFKFKISNRINRPNAAKKIRRINVV